MQLGNLENYIAKYISKELLTLGLEVFAIALIFGITFVWQDTHYPVPIQEAVILATPSDSPVSTADNSPSPTRAFAMNGDIAKIIAQTPSVTPKISQTHAKTATATAIQTPIPTPTAVSSVVATYAPIIIPTPYLIQQCSLNNSDIERELFAQVNIQRIAAGLEPLKWDEKMADVAREYSLDMAKNNFFSHINLKNETPWARASVYGVMVTAENIGKWTSDMDSLEKITAGTVSMWMASSGHRANILGEFTETGVGVMCSTNGYYLTQEFR